MSEAIMVIGDTFKIVTPDKDQFYAGEKDGQECWPIRHSQGCHGDCMDCRGMWEERLDKLALLPMEVLQHKGSVMPMGDMAALKSALIL